MIEHIQTIGRNRIEMIGKKFGRLTVIEMHGERILGRHPNWRCNCDCGNESIKSSIGLRNGREPSCGCASIDYQRNKYDLTGKVFGRLTVISPSDSNKKRNIVWYCKCNCGNYKYACGSDLRNGHTRSCGCLHNDVLLEKSTKHGHAKAKNLSPTYVSWASMFTRCTNKKARNYKDYGGRGIKICEEWKDFRVFLADMGERPKDRTIDRIDVDGDYIKDNCRWATWSQQQSNKRKK